jgi:hypothetical protein
MVRKKLQQLSSSNHKSSLQTEISPCLQEGAEKMHANQSEETSELTLYDQLHVQPAGSSFQMKPNKKDYQLGG